MSLSEIFSDVLLDDIPVGPIYPQSGAGLRFELNGRRMIEASHLQAEGLTTTTGAKF